jgi:hypothetical protein
MKDTNGWEIVSTYSTKQAVADGYLVKVDAEASKETGIKFPVYITRAVWDKYVSVPRGFHNVQNIEGRLWDVLYMFAVAAVACAGDLLTYQLNVKIPCNVDWETNEKRVPELNDKYNIRQVALKAVIQAQDFDDPSPAIFIMKPNED